MKNEIKAINLSVKVLNNLKELLEAEAKGRMVGASNKEEVFGYYITEIDGDGDSICFFSKLHPSKRLSSNRLSSYVTLGVIE